VGRVRTYSTGENIGKGARYRRPRVLFAYGTGRGAGGADAVFTADFASRTLDSTRGADASSGRKC
jgi:hypothetical protein